MSFAAESVVVEVALRRRRLHCPECEASTGAGCDRRPVASRWRHTDVGTEGDGAGRSGCVGCSAWPPTCGPRRSPSPGTAQGSRDPEDLVAWRPRPTRAPSPGNRVSTETAPGGSANGPSPTPLDPAGWTVWSTSGWKSELDNLPRRAGQVPCRVGLEWPTESTRIHNPHLAREPVGIAGTHGR